MNAATASVTLTDEQVRRYVADGFVVLDSGLSAAFHAAVTDELRYAMAHEKPLPGDNLLPRIPALAELLAAPAVHGAVASVLGPEFAWAPHRFPHNSEPLADPPDHFDAFENGPRMGKGSISGSGWHQDGHSRAGRARWHTFRAANLFYFPHDTPLAMGPTRLLAGSHLYANLHGIRREQAFMRAMPAGSVVLADFDVAHAGAPNRTEKSRYMLKFVALRQRNPTAPSWQNLDAEWRTPANLHTPHDLPVAWRSLWNWLRGADRNAGQSTAAASENDVASMVAAMCDGDQQQRLAALYGLAAVGEAAVGPLAAALLDTAGKGRDVSPPPDDRAFYGVSEDPRDRRFTNRQCVLEDAAVALGAIGAPAVPKLAELLAHDDAWIRINAAYALGEAGPAADGRADEVGRLLAEPADAVVRNALDALCALPFGPETVARIHHLLTTAPPAWQAPAMGKHWRLQDQVRYAACWALVARASGNDQPEGLEAALLAALHDDTGYVPATACEGLRRLGTPAGLQAAVDYLQPRRWDTVHHRFTRAGAVAG